MNGIILLQFEIYSAKIKDELEIAIEHFPVTKYIYTSLEKLWNIKEYFPKICNEIYKILNKMK